MQYNFVMKRLYIPRNHHFSHAMMLHFRFRCFVIWLLLCSRLSVQCYRHIITITALNLDKNNKNMMLEVKFCYFFLVSTVCMPNTYENLPMQYTDIFKVVK